jgi:hypothetical protein
LLEGLESQRGHCPFDAGDVMQIVGDEAADIMVALDVELCQQIVLAADGVDLGGNLTVGHRRGHRIGLAEMAFDMNKEALHRTAFWLPCRE